MCRRGKGHFDRSDTVRELVIVSIAHQIEGPGAVAVAQGRKHIGGTVPIADQRCIAVGVVDQSPVRKSMIEVVAFDRHSGRTIVHHGAEFAEPQTIPWAMDRIVLDQHTAQAGWDRRVTAIVPGLDRHGCRTIRCGGCSQCTTACDDRILDRPVGIAAMLQVDVDPVVERIGAVHATVVHGDPIHHHIVTALDVDPLDQVVAEVASQELDVVEGRGGGVGCDEHARVVPCDLGVGYGEPRDRGSCARTYTSGSGIDRMIVVEPAVLHAQSIGAVGKLQSCSAAHETADIDQLDAISLSHHGPLESFEVHPVHDGTVRSDHDPIPAAGCRRIHRGTARSALQRDRLVQLKVLHIHPWTDQDHITGGRCIDRRLDRTVAVAGRLVCDRMEGEGRDRTARITIGHLGTVQGDEPIQVLRLLEGIIGKLQGQASSIGRGHRQGEERHGVSGRPAQPLGTQVDERRIVIVERSIGVAAIGEDTKVLHHRTCGPGRSHELGRSQRGIGVRSIPHSDQRIADHFIEITIGQEIDLHLIGGAFPQAHLHSGELGEKQLGDQCQCDEKAVACKISFAHGRTAVDVRHSDPCCRRHGTLIANEADRGLTEGRFVCQCRKDRM